MKHKIFIGSSSEHQDCAESVQLHLSKIDDVEVVCWNQGVFQTGHYILDDILAQLEKSSFGVFVLAPDDFIQIRGETYYSVRDNVLFELGMFYGALGKECTFFLVPQSNNFEFRIPTDLKGMTYATYPYCPNDDNFYRSVSTACIELKRLIKTRMNRNWPKTIIERYGTFPEFDSLYAELFKKCTSVQTGFIHSRRWRESNLAAIDMFFKRDNVRWDIILPDLENDELIQMIKGHFSDGRTMVSKIIDAYTFCQEKMEKYPGKMTTYLYSYYPTYSFYGFDNKLILSLYPLTAARRPTPTMLLDIDADYTGFFRQDIEDIKSVSRRVSAGDLEKIIQRFC